MDELLWVLTDAQLSAAVLFLQSLSHLIEKDTLVNQRFKVFIGILKNDFGRSPSNSNHSSYDAGNFE